MYREMIQHRHTHRTSHTYDDNKIGCLIFQNITKKKKEKKDVPSLFIP